MLDGRNAKPLCEEERGEAKLRVLKPWKDPPKTTRDTRAHKTTCPTRYPVKIE